MRRDHLLTVHMYISHLEIDVRKSLTKSNRLDPAPDSISLLIGAEAGRSRRRSTQMSPSLHEQVHRRLPQLFSDHTDNADDDDGKNETRESETEDEQEAGGGFLGRVTSYNRLMHAHTRNQMSASTGTVPSYKKAMHAFTLNQFTHHQRISKSETSSPYIGHKQAILPSKLHGELSRWSVDEMPHGPSNTPEHGHRGHDVQGIDFRKLKRRSITEPIARDHTAVSRRDFAADS